MQKHYNYLNIDLDKKIHTKLKAKQGDSKSRYILVNLISNSTYYDLSDCAVKIYGIKKDKTIFFNHATVTNAKQGQFEIELTTQALAVTGQIEIQILILGTNEEKLTTFSFFIEVEKTIIDDAAIESTNEFTALTEALSSVQNIDNRFREVDEQFNTIENDIESLDYKQRNKKIRPVITFSIDDGSLEDYNKLFTLFKKYNIKGSSALICDKISTSGYMTLENILEMQEYGWEFASHSKHHNDLTTISDELLIEETLGARQHLENLGIKINNMFVPNGTVNDNVISKLQEYYRSARVSGSGSLGELNISPIRTHRVNSFHIGYNTSENAQTTAKDRLEDWKNKVSECIEKNGWLVFILHSYNLCTQNNRLSDLEQLIQYIQSLDIEILTYDDGLGVFANKIESEKLTIGCDGKVSDYSEYAKLRITKLDSYNGATPISDFPQISATINTVNNANYEGLVSLTGGTIITIKPDSTNERAFQLLKHYNDDNLYFRNPGGEWRNLSNINVIKNLPSTHSRTDLSNGKINVSLISSSNSSGYPSSAGGILIAWYLDGYAHNIKEEFKVINNDRTYTRYMKSDFSWSEWKEEIFNTNIKYDTVTNETPMTEFPVGTSFCQINANKANFPDATNGMLETHKYGSNGYNYQYYHVYNSTKTYKRVWNSSQSWGAWTMINS